MANRESLENLIEGLAGAVVEAQRRIEAQFATLASADVRHTVLGAHGCGAFGNPAKQVARLYRGAVEAHWDDLEHVVFAIYDAGYGPDNYTPFARAFA